MAIANPVEVIEREDNIELELKRVRENVRSAFLELIECLKRRENELLRELDEILESYHSYRNEIVKVTQQRKDLEKLKQMNEQELQNSSAKTLIENTLNEINKELNLLKEPTQPQIVRFVCDNNKRLLSEIAKLGEYVDNTRIHYKSKIDSVVSVCKRGKGIDQLYDPEGVTVDNTTGMIYVVDCWNNCMKVFDNTGKYLSRIGVNIGDGKMDYPHSLAIYENRILISQGYYWNSTSCILNYQLDGKFISRIGRHGTADLEFRIPFGLTINQTNGDIYVCDRSNKRIQIISKDFQFISKFGEDSLSEPRDIKLSKDYIYVLDASNPCVYLFDYDHILQKKQITRYRGEGMLVSDPYFFFIDDSDNFLISDRGSNSILIFNPLFEFIHKISVSDNPMGIVIDKHRRIIVVSEGPNHCIQIF